MKTINISDGTTNYAGTLPDGWHEVPVSAFIQYEEQRESLKVVERMCLAAHLLTGIPMEVLTQDVSIAATIQNQCLWFFDSLPEPFAVEELQHAGKSFTWCGSMEKLTAGQFEALVEYIQQAQGKPLTQIHVLLAILYQEQGKPQTATSVAKHAELFLSLPMDKAYSAIGFFLSCSGPSAQRILKSSELENQVMVTLKNLEVQLSRLSSNSSKRGTLRRKYLSWLLSRLRKLTPSGQED